MRFIRFIDPKTSFAFRKIFESLENKDILISFINAMLRFNPGHEVVDLTIIDPRQSPKIKGMKDTYPYVKARSRDGREFIVEVQILHVAGFEKSVPCDAAKNRSVRIGEAEDYPRLNPVIALTVTDFIMFEETPDIISKFRLLDKHDFFEYPDSDLELVFVELPKFDKTEEQLADITDKWIYFLKNARSLESVPQTLAVEQPISNAFQIINKANLTTEELDNQERHSMFIQDRRGALIKAYEQGFKRGMRRAMGQEMERIIQIKWGIQEGMIEGEEQGFQQGMKRAAKNLYDLYRKGIITSEEAKAELEELYVNKPMSEEIYREFLSKIQSKP